MFVLAFSSKERVVGAYLSANETERGALVLEDVQKVAEELTGKEISKLKPQKAGIRFARPINEEIA